MSGMTDAKRSHHEPPPSASKPAPTVRVDVVALPAHPGCQFRVVRQQTLIAEDGKILSRVLDHRPLDAVRRFAPVASLTPEEKEPLDRLIAEAKAGVRL